MKMWLKVTVNLNVAERHLSQNGFRLTREYKLTKPSPPTIPISHLTQLKPYFDIPVPSYDADPPGSCESRSRLAGT